MTHKQLALILPLLLGDCERTRTVSGSEAPAGSRGALRVSPAERMGALTPDANLTNDPARLVGTWRTRPTGGYEWRGLDVVLEITRERIVATSGCAKFDWHYHFEGKQITLDPKQLVSCLPSLSASELEFAETMGTVTAAYHRGGRGLVFEGPKGRVVVFEHRR